MSKRRTQRRQASEQDGFTEEPFLRPGDLLVIQQEQDGSLHLVTVHEVDFAARGQVFIGIESMLPKRNESVQ